MHHHGNPVTDIFHPSRKVGAWGLALLTFFNVSGGPWGGEPIISSAGPLPGFLCILFMAVFWGLPMSLVTSEMSSALPNNGGYVLWVDVAFGKFWGFQESFWSWGSCVVDNALYPVLAYETFIAMFEGDIQNPLDAEALEAQHSWVVGYVSKLVLTVLFSLPVLFGKTEWVTHGMGIMVVLLTVPFAIMLPYIIATRPMDWSQLLKSRPKLFSNPEVDWVGLLHVTFWNFNGFDCASTCAGEVCDPGRAYPRGILSALVVIVLMTALPLVVATAANTPPWENWNVGWWSAIANANAGFGFAWSVVFSSLIGTFGMHAAVMWEDAWQLCGMAEQGMAPRWLAGRNEKLGTPQNATLVSMGVVMLLIMFDFRSMVIVDNFFSVASGLLEIAAFAHLKRTRPDLVRPFSIPYVTGDFTLFLFLLVPVTLGFFILATSFDDGWVSFFTLVPFLVVGFFLPFAFEKHKDHPHGVKRSQRGASFNLQQQQEDHPLLMISETSPPPPAPSPAIGVGVYGALQAAGVVPPSPLKTGKGFQRDFSRDSFVSSDRAPGSVFAGSQPDGEGRRPSTTTRGWSQTGEEEEGDQYPEEEDDDGHIFVDDTVQFGSIFTDPKMFRQEDDEFLSAVGRSEMDFQKLIDEDEEAQLNDEPDEEEEVDGNNGKRKATKWNRKWARTGSSDVMPLEYYAEGTDEERSYDEASLD